MNKILLPFLLIVIFFLAIKLKTVQKTIPERMIVRTHLLGLVLLMTPAKMETASIS